MVTRVAVPISLYAIPAYDQPAGRSGCVTLRIDDGTHGEVDGQCHGMSCPNPVYSYISSIRDRAMGQQSWGVCPPRAGSRWDERVDTRET